MLKFTINNFLELRLEEGKTNIYVDNELFIQCKYLLIHVSIDEYEDCEGLNSIDEVIERLDKSLEFVNPKSNLISPEVQFWGHCSNLQAWYENNYDSSLIHSNLAFPLLKKLAEAGDILAIRVFKEEIVRRFDRGCITIVRFILYNGYLNFLDKEELQCVFNQSTFKIIKHIMKELNKLMISPLDNYRAIKELIDLILFIDLKFNQNILITIFQNLPQETTVKFSKTALLHLNYKEFQDYKIPYGKYYLYFENIINYLYKNYSHFGELINLLDSGFYNSPISLDEQLSHGTVLYK
ncbi:MAG: hypothetical protein ACXAC5_20640 [Promethearchaeota archaeon]|jgi:hypothetical protein